jgi:Icc-related predicted phosphoesterase
MKLLLFSDLHADVGAAERLVALGADADLWVGAGDFGNLRRQVDVCLRVLGRVGKPAVLVPGNNESDEELRKAAAEAWPAARVLHGQGTTISGVSVFGIGGGIPKTPFGPWSFDLDEVEAAKLLTSMKEQSMLVSHSPPLGHVDRDSRGRSLGSRAVLAAVERAKPRLVVCGHIHGSAGQWSQVGESRVINAGPQGMLCEWPS